MWVSGWLLAFFAMSARFSTLKINGQMCDAIKAHRARAATCGAEQ